MNQLETILHSIQTTKTQLKKQLANTTDPHIKQKIEHQIHCINQEETEILQKLNLQLKDITLTEEEEDDNQ